MEPVDYSQAHAFPLIRSDGAFLMLMGLGIVAGAPFFRWRYPALTLGAAIGAAALAILAYPLSAPYGAPTMLAIASLAAAVAFEALLIATLISRFKTERGRTIGVLTIVGAHFVIMAPAFGPLIVLLGFLCMINALSGLFGAAHSLPKLWAADGAFKIAVGAAMWFGHVLPGGIPDLA